MGSLAQKITFICYYFNILIIFQLINISKSQLINNIIKLGEENATYSHFSFNSNGDMIIDTTSFPVNKERFFFGLKQNGKFYFKADNSETPYYSMIVDNEKGRIEGDSYFIKISSSNPNIHGKELICGISKIGENNEGEYVEFYNLDEQNYTKYKTLEMFGNIFSDSFVINKAPDKSDSYYYYLVNYKNYSSNTKYYNNIKKIYFSFEKSQGYGLRSGVEPDEMNDNRLINGFYTDNSIYILTYLSRSSSTLKAKAYNNSDFTQAVKSIIYKPNSYNEKIFFKGIHLKGEIGFFIYFKSGTIEYPSFSILQCNQLLNMTTYLGYSIKDINDRVFNSDKGLNDIIKLNNFQICYISMNSDKTQFQLVIFTLYNNDALMNMRYYDVEMWNSHGMKIFLNIKAALYNNFISLAFSHCPQSDCSEPNDPHYSSLILFNYPNSTYINLNLIPQLISSNRKIEKDFSFNFGEPMEIENNIFGLVFKGTKIMKISSGFFLTNTTNNENLGEGSFILKNENVSLYFENHENYEPKDYIIEYAYVLMEPDYEIYNSYSFINGSLGNSQEDESTYFKYHEYIGKSSNFTINITDRLITNCISDLCSLCFTNYECVTCNYNYTIFNGHHKTCLPNYTMPTTIPTTILTIIPTTIPKTIPTTIPTNIPTTNPMTILTTISTNFLTTIPTTNPMTIPTTFPTSIPTTILTTTFPVIIPTTIPIIYTTYPYSNKEIVASTIPKIYPTTENEECSEEEILQGKCSGKMTNEQIGEIYNKLKDKISPNANEIIETENVIFQISTLEEQKNSNNPNVSSIDLGDCEKLLKQQEELSDNDNLIVLKTDIKSEDLSSTYVQYEIYNPITLKKVSMDICKDIPISVSVPVSLDESTKSVFDSLSQSGYNLFDLNDSFYNDICSTYTTENGTDLTLADRKNIIYDNNGNISMCQDGCTFQSYNSTTRKAKCDCSVQTKETITDASKISFDKKDLADSFFNTLKNSNFLVLKCYKLVFSKKGQTNNIGSYLMTAVTCVFIILMFIYIINGNKKIEYFIQIILKIKLTSSFKPKKNYKSKKSKKNFKNKGNKKNKTKSAKMYYNKNKNVNFPPKRKSNKSTNINSTYKKSWDNLISFPERSKSKKNLLGNIKKSKKNNNNNKIDKNSSNKNNHKISTINRQKEVTSNNVYKVKDPKMNIDKIKISDLNDEELNNLEYEYAIIIDKRTYFQYYYSLLKKKQLIIFAFYPANDYNLIAVKISLLLLSFSLYFTINGFFFSDETMNKINEDNGVYDIVFQIPQIMYSTVISIIINMILKRLSLSERNILAIKSESNYLIAQNKSKNIKMCIKIKLAIFFILSFIFMAFFWYFISCFCAVYKNTQQILIKDTLISFTISMLYPFGLNLLPGILRMYALRAIKKDKKCLYKISGLIALI